MNPTKVQDRQHSHKLAQIGECPICLDVIRPPVCQCEGGHAMCKICFDQLKLEDCLLCNRPVFYSQDVGLEQLREGLSNMKISCQNAVKGCSYNIASDNKESHEKECRYRTFKCEGKTFAGWNCNWTGPYFDIHKHFKEAHKRGKSMEFKMDISMNINLLADFKDINVVSFFDGQAYFYYKHFIDTNKQKIYWAFQYIGLRDKADKFFYEFEIYKGAVRKFKMSEVCFNDTTKIEDIFQLEKCVVMSFASAMNFINAEGRLSLRFRIRKCIN